MIYTQEAQLSRLLELQKKGLTNRQLAVCLEVKHATVCKYKRMLRSKGFFIEGVPGRPSLKLKKENSNITNIGILSTDDNK